ncbi:tonsoku-like protein isoform X2 [Neocloeon triangulifer]|uniref:tonsoku-like protein isoform X2 n=1 Tax=Neocloeon triangulifer TaxID=2078957 RepID=UPI00286F0FF7|nr:tonsoku-like protein isoform X2 [Neocloeon triangulifer]
MERQEKRLRNKLSKAIGDKNYEEIYQIRCRLSELKREAGNPDAAVTELKDLIDDLRNDKKQMRVAQVHRLTGETLMDTTNASLAEKHFERYLAAAKAEGDVAEEQRAYASLGRFHFCMAQDCKTDAERDRILKKSHKSNLKSLSLANELDAEGTVSKREIAQMKSRIFMNIALAYEMSGKIDEAEKYAKFAVETCRNSGSSNYDTAMCHRVLGVILSKRSHVEGLKQISEASNLASSISDPVGRDLLFQILESEAEILFSLGNFSQAKECLIRAYQLETTESKELIERNLKIVIYLLNSQDKLRNMDEDNYLERKKLFDKMGDYAVELKAFSSAVTYYKNMLEYSEKLGDDSKSLSAALVSIASSYADMRKYQKAMEYYEREKDLWPANPKEECRSRMNLASVCEKRNDLDNQLYHLKMARTLAITCENKSLELEVLLLLQSYYESYCTLDKNLEDDITNLKSELGSQESDSQSMDVEEEEVAPEYESIDLKSLPELQPKESRERRTRTKQDYTKTRNEKGETKLHTACIKGDFKTVQFLVKNGHVVNVYDNSGWAPIHEASNFGHAEIVSFLLDHGAKINDQGKPGSLECDGTTPLIDASSNGHFTVIELLLDRGAKIELRTVKERLNALNSLDKWYTKMKNKKEIIEEDTERCSIIRERMIELLKKAGEEIEQQSSVEPEFTFGTDGNYFKGSGTRLAQLRGNRDTHSSDDADPEQISMKRRKGTQKILYSDDDNEELDDTQPTSSRRRSVSDDDGAGPSQRRHGGHSSVNEYRNVIDSMKRRNMPTQPRAPAKYNTPALAALVPEEEANVEWLEDDMGPSTSKSSKRRRSSEDKPEQTQQKRSKRKSQVSTSSSSSLEEILQEVVPDIPPFEDVTYHYVSQDSESSSAEEEIVPIRPFRRISPTKKSPSKRHRIIKSPNVPQAKPSPKKLFETDESISVRAKIEGKIFLVPISSRDISIGGVAEKIAERYMKMEGMEPKLTLTRSDGAILSPDDPLSVILKSSETEVDVCALVDSLVLPPLSKRYAEACKLEKVEEDEHIIQCLEASQATLQLVLKNLPLGPQAVPILKAIQKETSLQTIDFSGCGLEDSGLELLNNALGSFENLQSLNLSCNYITSKGLESMGKKVEETRSLKGLKNLDLSCNMIGEEGLKPLAALLDCLELTSLNLSDCELEVPRSHSFSDIPFLALDAVEELDVSYNPLGNHGISYLFGRLNAWNLKKLNLSYSCALPVEEENDGDSVAKELELLFLKIVVAGERGGVIDELNLSGCNLKDQNILELLSSANDKGIAIEHIVISNNADLTSDSLLTISSHYPLIKKITATGCPNLYDKSVTLSDKIETLSICVSSVNLPQLPGTVMHGPAGYVQVV